jgi:hypothetical protein
MLRRLFTLLSALSLLLCVAAVVLWGDADTGTRISGQDADIGTGPIRGSYFDESILWRLTGVWDGR